MNYLNKSYSPYSSFTQQEVPTQSIGNFQLFKEIGWDDFLLVPTFQGVWVMGYGFLGARQEWARGRRAVFTRTTFSGRIPSLLDRYSSMTNSKPFIGNPDLKAESDWTETIGGELKGDVVEGSLQGYLQYRQNPRVYVDTFYTTVSNVKDAYIMAIMANGKWKLSKWVEAFDSVTLSHSRVIETSNEFPYLR